ncbi:MAG: hypothetical protein M3362_22745 [Acidobacteriota bacterium]|nr:hypothetical protein [Acidobacteriota bacterium]
MKRHLVLVFLIISVLQLTACSYMTDFVVVNESDYSIEVRYKVKNYPYSYPFTPPTTPATIAASQLDTNGGQKWKELTSAQYRLDQVNRTVTIRLMPHEALRIVRTHDDSWHQDSSASELFPLEEINVVGTDGELSLKGRQAFTSFSKVSSSLYTFTYK